MGRPSNYDELVADLILDRITDGEALSTILKGDDMPAPSSVYRWLEANKEFRDKYTRAREAQGDLMDSKVLETADNSTPETAHSDRVKIDAYKWRAGHLRPKVYGAKVQAEVSGVDGSPIVIHWKPSEAQS